MDFPVWNSWRWRWRWCSHDDKSYRVIPNTTTMTKTISVMVLGMIISAIMATITGTTMMAVNIICPKFFNTIHTFRNNDGTVYFYNSVKYLTVLQFSVYTK